jgi:hypothetical protein
MRPEIHELIEAVRALDLRLTGKPSPRCIRIGGDPADFPRRLADLQEKLERVDASGALAEEASAPASDEIAKYKKALDGLLRFIQVGNVDMETAVDIVAEALGVEAAKRQKAYETLPAFAPKGWKRKKRFSPRLRLLPDQPGDVSLSLLRSLAFEADMTAAMMGQAFERPREAPDREPRVPRHAPQP